MLFPRVARSSAAGAVKRGYATIADSAGVKVAGFENVAPAGTASVTVVVKAGSRYEPQAGVAHALKNFVYKSTSDNSALKTARLAELYGGSLSASLGREHLFLTAEFLRGDEEEFLAIIAKVLSSSLFHAHEYNELVLPMLQAEHTTASSVPSTLGFDLLHALAFRRGLGNSLYASPHYPVSAQTVKDFAQQAFAKSNLGVIGLNLSTESLSKAVQAAFGSGSGGGSSLSAGKTKYFGGEQRIAMDAHASQTAQPTMIIAYGAASAPTAEHLVLPHLFGGKPSVKWGYGTSPLSAIPEKFPGATAEAFVFPYSDASLFGVKISAPTSKATADAAKLAVSLFKEMPKKQEDVKKAVAKAQFAEARRLESTEGLMTTAGSVSKLDANMADFSFSPAWNELSKAKPSIVAIGDLDSLPYSDEMGI